MIAPDIPANEPQRQLAVERYNILDSLPESCFDDITALMSHISGAPISLITLLDRDRNYLKSHHGVPFSESPRNISFCGHAINEASSILIIEDARLDERFAGNPLVTEHDAIFYAGVPLVTPDGYKLGTLCLFDQKPRTLNSETISALKMMAHQVELLLDLRLKNAMLISTKNNLERHNSELAKFARAISHDIKSPLTSLLFLTDAAVAETDASGSSLQLKMLNKIKNSALTLSDYTDNLLQYYMADETNRGLIEQVNVAEVLSEVTLLFGSSKEVNITLSAHIDTVNTNRASLSQVLLNLVSNAAKYSDKVQTKITVSCIELGEYVQFSVQDNGMGIPLQEVDDIFDLFETTNRADRHGNIGSGIGLHSVKRLVENLGGSIWVSSTIGEGSTFTFTLPSAELTVE